MLRLGVPRLPPCPTQCACWRPHRASSEPATTVPAAMGLWHGPRTCFDLVQGLRALHFVTHLRSAIHPCDARLCRGLSHNQLTGKLPSALSALTAVQQLYARTHVYLCSLIVHLPRAAPVWDEHVLQLFRVSS